MQAHACKFVRLKLQYHTLYFLFTIIPHVCCCLLLRSAFCFSLESHDPVSVTCLNCCFISFLCPLSVNINPARLFVIFSLPGR